MCVSVCVCVGVGYCVRACKVVGEGGNDDGVMV